MAQGVGVTGADLIRFINLSLLHNSGTATLDRVERPLELVDEPAP
jgi:hypothetical protein